MTFLQDICLLLKSSGIMSYSWFLSLSKSIFPLALFFHCLLLFLWLLLVRLVRNCMYIHAFVSLMSSGILKVFTRAKGQSIFYTIYWSFWAFFSVQLAHPCENTEKATAWTILIFVYRDTSLNLKILSGSFILVQNKNDIDQGHF